jgi:SOS-response transcriptional repressor LexA
MAFGVSEVLEVGTDGDLLVTHGQWDDLNGFVTIAMVDDDRAAFV